MDPAPQVSTLSLVSLMSCLAISEPLWQRAMFSCLMHGAWCAGKRYCMNAAALRFIPEGEELPPESKPVNN